MADDVEVGGDELRRNIWVERLGFPFKGDSGVLTSERTSRAVMVARAEMSARELIHRTMRTIVRERDGLGRLT